MSLRIHASDKTRLIMTAIAIAIAIMLVIIVGVTVVPEKYSEYVPAKWVRFAFVNAFLVFYELKAYWKLRKSGQFWSIFLGLLGVYLFGLGYFFYSGTGVSLVVFALAGGAEFAGMALVIYWVLGVGPSKVNLNLSL